MKNTTKEELLELKDLSCPVCIDILIEPVRLPCQHLLCLDCYRKTTDVSEVGLNNAT